MSLTHTVLGQPGHDNAALVQVNSGHAVRTLLFDCGESCISSLDFSVVLGIDHVFFSHFHIDHVAGFDSLFRALYQRDTKPLHIWGPSGTARIINHRFQGFTWNLHAELGSTWFVHDILEDRVLTTAFRQLDGSVPTPTEQVITGQVFQTDDFGVDALLMDHLTPSVAYMVRETPRTNLEPARLSALGLRPGAWVRQLKQPEPGQTVILTEGVQHDLEALRRELLVTTPGDSIAYLTDFLLDESAQKRLEVTLNPCQTVICESQYRHADLVLAQKNHHMTSKQVAELAVRAGVGDLVFIHLSDRYDHAGWRDMLLGTQVVFPGARFPTEWNLV
jgi:ribonuclease Z